MVHTAGFSISDIFISRCNIFSTRSTIHVVFISSVLDHRWDLQPTAIAEEFDRTCEMWARGIPYSEDAKKGSGNSSVKNIILS